MIGWCSWHLLPALGISPCHWPGSLHDDDRNFVERWCRRIAADSHDPSLVATASLALGHLARRFGSLDPESVALVERLATDPSLDDRVLSALDDATLFLQGSGTEAE